MMKRYLLMDQTKKKVSIPLDDVLVVAIFYLLSMLLIGCCYRRIRSAGATEEIFPTYFNNVMVINKIQKVRK
ncbi:hypothetical protein P8452_30001 [Trifolium repens]|nr:hypothetical protein P8452_30001 [Trifolium repens]